MEGLLLSLRHGGRAEGEADAGRGAGGDEGLGGASWRRRRSPATAAEDGRAADNSPLLDHSSRLRRAGPRAAAGAAGA